MHRIAKSSIAILSGVSLFVVITLFMSSPDDPPESDSDWAVTADRILNRSLQGGVFEPLPAVENPRRQAVYLGLLITGLLCLLYGYRRQRYIGEWIGVWVLLTFTAYLISRGYANAGGAGLAMGAVQVSKVAGAVLLMRSAHSFFGTTPLTRWDWVLVPGLVGWLAIGGGRLSVPVVLAPAYLITGILGLRTAVLFGSGFARRRMLGALLLSVSVAVIGITNLAFGTFFASVLASDQLLLLFLSTNSLCFLASAFGMHLLVLDDVVGELRVTNSRLEEAQEELQRIATIDPLTGCNNRYFLEQNIGRELQRPRRSRTPLSLLFVDIDRFKKINDSFGHDVGDRVLEYVGEFLRRTVRGADYVVRWGGDEFVILMGCTGAEAMAKARVFTENFEAAVDSNVLPPGLSLSIGLAEIPTDATDILPYIRLADQNMYANKGSSASE